MSCSGWQWEERGSVDVCEGWMVKHIAVYAEDLPSCATRKLEESSKTLTYLAGKRAIVGRSAWTYSIGSI